MKIRKRLNLNTVIAIAAVVLIILSLAWSYREESKANRNMELVEEIRNVAFERVMLRDDFLLHGEERAKIQWHAKSETLRRMLDMADQRFTGGIDRDLLRKARKDFDATHGSISSFMEHQKRRDQGSTRDFNLTETESMLISQAFLKAYSLTDSINKLHVSAEHELERVRERSIVIVVFFVFVGIIVIIANSTILNRLLNRRITELAKGIGIIGAGDLEHRIDAQGDDELSALARGANEMAGKLKMSHTSVENLRQEVAERKQAEEALKSSLSLLTASLESTADGILIVDRQGKIARWNRKFAEMWRIPEEVLSSREDQEVINHILAMLADPEQFAAKVRELYEQPERSSFDQIEFTDGGVFERYSQPQMIEDTVVGRVWSFRDVTERKQSEHALKESEEKFRIIFDCSKDGIILADIESKKFYTVNKTFCDMLQYTHDEIRQLCVADIHPEEELPRLLDAFERGVRQESVLEGDIPVRRKDGSVFWTEITASPVTISGKKYLLGNFRDVTDRRKADEAVTRLGLAVEQAAEAIVITDTKGTIQYVNPAFERSTGYSREEAVGKNPGVLRSGKHDEAFYRGLWDTLTRGDVWTGHFINQKKDGSLFEEDATISPLRDSSGKIVNYVASKRDVTEMVSLERQVRTAQKMEAVGTLAGGIAHDFNNSLTGIFGFGELLRMRMAGDEQDLHDLDEILRCAERAATLTRQLLTFARRQVIEPVNLNVSTLVADLMKLIAKLVGEHIEVKTSPGKNVPTIHADRGQIEQVVMNLCLNARDAMPDGGRLVVETEDVYLEEEHVRRNPYMKRGRYALLTVSDTGIGMEETIRERVFEPFFTTKGPDKGTGLGLAMVYGIVKQHGGFIHLYSEPGKGTAFKVYLPATEAQPDAVPEKRKEEIVRGGTETILLAEDEEAIRALAERILTGFGYTVLVARNGEEAIEIFRRNQGIDLAVLDVVMPRKGGREAFEEMHKANPGLKVIFMSGYSTDAIHDSFVLIAGTPFLQKPFGPTILARKVREVLDTQ